MFHRFSRRALAVVVCAAACASSAQNTDQVVKIVVPFGTASSTDLLAREIGQQMAVILKQTVIVENKPGAEGTIGAQAVLTAAPDGNTMFLTTSSTSVLDGLLRKSATIDPVKDFSPVCGVSKVGMVAYITSTLPFKTVHEFLAAAKAQPDKFTFGYSSPATRLAGELFQQQAGVKLRGIPYRTTAAAFVDVAGGQVDMFINDATGASALYKAGKLRPIVTATAQRVETVPEVPSAPEAGLAGFEMSPWFGTFVSAKTPPAMVARLRDAVTQAMKAPGVVAMLDRGGMQALPICGDDLAKFQVADIDRWREVIRKAGIQPE